MNVRHQKLVVFGLPKEDDAMKAAVFMAQQTVGKLLSALQSPAANQSRFTVKKRFPLGGSSAEHLWLSKVTYDGAMIYGEVGNKPEHTREVRFGDKASVAPKEVSDWMFVEDGKLVGGFSIRVFYNRMGEPQKQQFVKTVGCTVE